MFVAGMAGGCWAGFRISSEERDLFLSCRHIKGMSLSEFLKAGALSYAQQIKLDKSLSKKAGNLNRVLMCKIKRYEIKQRQHDRYLIANYQAKLFKCAGASLRANGKEVKIEIMKGILKDMKEEYNLLNPQIKKELKSDFIEMQKNWLELNNIYRMLNINKVIEAKAKVIAIDFKKSNGGIEENGNNKDTNEKM